MSVKKKWFITGASSGLGLALATVALERGDEVVLAARRVEALNSLASLFPKTALAVALDVTSAHMRMSAVKAALDRFGHLDVLANIAGRGSLGAAEEFSEAQLREQMEINFFAATEITREVLPNMRSRRTGHILQLTSIGGIVAFQGFAPYCASKFALEGWSEALRSEVAPLGIKVTIVEPGAFRTEFAGDKNMRPDVSIDAYKDVIGPVQKYLYGSDGKQPGDPRKAAQAMLQVVDSTNPPLRLVLGVDAIELLEKKQKSLEKELTSWRSVGESTGFAGAIAAPVGG